MRAVDRKGELKALVVQRWKVLGARIDEEALEADHAGVEQRTHRSEARRRHPTPEPDVDTELSLGRVALGRQGIGVDRGRDAVDGHVDEGRDAARSCGCRGGGEPLPGRVARLAHVHVSVDNAGEHDGVRTDRDLLRCQGIRTDGEQRCDDPVAHADGSGPLPAARNDPLCADKEVQRRGRPRRNYVPGAPVPATGPMHLTATGQRSANPQVFSSRVRRRGLPPELGHRHRTPRSASDCQPSS